MRKFSFYLFIITLSIAFTSCKSEPKEKEITEKPEKGLNETTWDNAMKKIDDEIAISDAVANSLYYSKESGESEKVVAYLSQDNKILKVEESYSGKANENSGRVVYYLNNTLPMITIERFEDKSNLKSVNFVERISYYNEKGEATYTKEKRVVYEDELPNASFQAVDLVTLSTDKIFRILNQEGEFQTTFQGLVETDALNYLIVGEPKEDGYTSAMRIEFEDHFIKEIYKSPKKFMNKKVRVTFQVSRIQGNFEYQIYTGGSWD
ncbi:MAG: hypothetical protein PHQ74_13535 [Crocinitomicaceae bacterium]|nr:hypothetical protein [Crocinitomicaceae bacterium]